MKRPGDESQAKDFGMLAKGLAEAEPVVALLADLAARGDAGTRAREVVANETFDLLLGSGNALAAIEAVGDPVARFEAEVARLAADVKRIRENTDVEDKKKRAAIAYLRRNVGKRGKSHARALLAAGRREEAAKLIERLTVFVEATETP